MACNKPIKLTKPSSNSKRSNCNQINKTQASAASSWDQNKSKLSPLEWHVTQEKVTERPFTNKYYRHWEPGSYNCVVCHTKLFKSDMKFESKSGWPAFSDILEKNLVELKPDLSHIGANLLLLVARPDLARTEVSCSSCKSHLGHLFHDGPKPTGLRYCINSSSLTFVPASEEKMELSNPSRCAVGKMCFIPNNADSFLLTSNEVTRIWNKNPQIKNKSIFQQISSHPLILPIRETTL